MAELDFDWRKKFLKIERKAGGKQMGVPKRHPLDRPQPPERPEPEFPHGGHQRRHVSNPLRDPDEIWRLKPDSPAIQEGRTIFPGYVVKPEDSPRLLVSGKNNRKLGKVVEVGPLRGFPIFHLTLEERRTCPRSCDMFRDCYGNSMNRARRHVHGIELERILWRELEALQASDHPGFLVRLHTLGDFYSARYVDFWAAALMEFSKLHVFGFTSRDPQETIGRHIYAVRRAHPDRFCIRFSRPYSLPGGARVIWRLPEAANVPEGLVCPAQTHKTDCCATCGICWAPAARHKTIVFIAHGRTKRGPKDEPDPK